jgi:hypothetical protein
MKAKTAGFIASLGLCCLGFGSPASALLAEGYNNYFQYSDSFGDTASLDIHTEFPVTPSGVPVINITGTGDFAPSFGSDYTSSFISGPDTTCCGADNILSSIAPYVDSSGIAFDVFSGGDPTVLVTSSSGTLTPTPLPAALPLFAGGLGAMGLFGWRRKRKTKAVA